ncbi:hypothetical protein A2926_00045 [Candidatus Giovannonibacteria bacterium RIFCSPLOWO2_01_FULL_44_40]|uniref:Uncharacterized protein n=1 Tax=Candidatus Giovannonibacteria bacterium RIFCSPHIGHO2_01_FULL_45_23 TaxID=1798325 RepID=A0A1F5VFH0_9BACT|nr:MAG: hypothetical protein A2834_01000 [Candidatus Giovannonibacteria bacterium RIFCSPHIGHO2_01_FULL_45_23]OGF75303.1 MAG: hypothetical protein A3C77_01210 [Candidatus Giovannonibacteria bacterium RIFCSPHIGHO2_02_FULL_45_13]OGF80373.1 MAG: hypothetical protein A2926_00045 [Candidatus Giovannonibacteria bacterium RIFCSPLOWO2_01_FULL_44_40]
MLLGLKQVQLSFAIMLLAIALAFSLFYLNFFQVKFFGRLVRAEELALGSMQFVKDDAMLEENLGKRDFWVNKYVCQNGSCEVDKRLQVESITLSSVTPPQLYLENLETLYDITGNKEFESELRSSMNYLLQNCEKWVSICRRNFASFVRFAEKTGDEQAKKDFIALGNFLFQGPGFSLEDWLSRMDGIGSLLSIVKQLPFGDFLAAILEEGFALGQNIIAKELGVHVYAESGKDFYSNSCVGPLGDVKLYKAIGSARALERAEGFVQSAKISDHIAELDEPNVVQSSATHPGLTCANVLLSLFEVTKKQAYLDEFRQTMQYLVSNNLELVKGEKTKVAFSRKISGDARSRFTNDVLLFANLMLRDKDNEYRIWF